MAQTISRGKNIRSICNKILIQINSKIGGVPWAIKNIPFFNKPAMVVGYDVHHQRGQKSKLAIVASINQTGTRYCARVNTQEGENDEIAKNMSSLMQELLGAFKK